MDNLKMIQRRKLIQRAHIKAELDLERTILAKQRTLLAEINVFIGTVGLGILFLKFFEQLFFKIIGVIAATASIYMITRLVHKYNKFKRRIRKIDKRNNFYHKNY